MFTIDLYMLSLSVRGNNCDLIIICQAINCGISALIQLHNHGQERREESPGQADPTRHIEHNVQAARVVCHQTCQQIAHTLKSFVL